MLSNLSGDPRVPLETPTYTAPVRSVWADSGLATEIRAVLSGARAVMSLLAVAIEREPDPTRVAQAVITQTDGAELCERLERATAAPSPEALCALLIEMEDLCAEVSDLGLLTDDGQPGGGPRAENRSGARQPLG